MSLKLMLLTPILTSTVFLFAQPNDRQLRSPLKSASPEIKTEPAKNLERLICQFSNSYRLGRATKNKKIKQIMKPKEIIFNIPSPSKYLGKENSCFQDLLN